MKTFPATRCVVGESAVFLSLFSRFGHCGGCRIFSSTACTSDPWCPWMDIPLPVGIKVVWCSHHGPFSLQPEGLIVAVKKRTSGLPGHCCLCESCGKAQANLGEITLENSSEMSFLLRRLKAKTRHRNAGVLRRNTPAFARGQRNRQLWNVKPSLSQVQWGGRWTRMDYCLAQPIWTGKGSLCPIPFLGASPWLRPLKELADAVPKHCLLGGHFLSVCHICS